MAGDLEHYEHGAGVSHTNFDNMNSTVFADGKVVKKFRGESAWSDAARHAGDLAIARQRDRGEGHFSGLFNDRRRM